MACDLAARRRRARARRAAWTAITRNPQEWDLALHHVRVGPDPGETVGQIGRRAHADAEQPLGVRLGCAFVWLIKHGREDRSFGRGLARYVD